MEKYFAGTCDIHTENGMPGAISKNSDCFGCNYDWSYNNF
jgi:hypothetical protein